MNELEVAGIVIADADQAMLRAYVRGGVSGADLFAHIAQFDDLSSYQNWLHNTLRARPSPDASDLSVELLVAEVAAGLRRRNAGMPAGSPQVSLAYQAAIALVRPLRLGSCAPSIAGLVDPASVAA